jgi:hypothetical protein
MRLLRTMIVTGTAALAAGALTMTVATTATTAASGRSAHTAYRAPSAHFLAEARLALTKYLKHNHPQMLLAPHSNDLGPAVKGVTQEGSFNWSGYAKTSNSAKAFSSVSAKWTQPKVDCTAEDRMSATWVGFDGTSASNPTVEQDGTTGWCYQGKAIYFTWYEMFPAGSIEVGKSLKPGDKITATATRSGNNYTLKVSDATHSSSSFSKTLACKPVNGVVPCQASSVEWIEERPAFSTTGIIPLATYGSWKATSVADKSTGSTSTDSIAMVDSQDVYILSSVGNLSGGSFTTKFKDSY